MTLQRAILEIDGDADNDGDIETGVFTFIGNVRIEEAIRTGYLVSSAGTITNIGLNLLDENNAKRKGVFIDFGGGQHAFEISASGWEGATDGDGNPVQWGATDDPSVVDATSATGADPLTQAQVFMNYLRVTQTDSRNAARLRVGEYSSGGVLDDELQVAIESPQVVKRPDAPSTFDISMTLLETEDSDSAGDATKRNGA